MEQPRHEKIKLELADKFVATNSYLGNHIKQTIMQSDFKDLKEIQKPSHICKGDVFLVYEGKKKRPNVVIKVLKDRTIIYIPLTSTDNIHCLSESKSRFFGEGCFCKTFLWRRRSLHLKTLQESMTT